MLVVRNALHGCRVWLWFSELVRIYVCVMYEMQRMFLYLRHHAADTRPQAP